MRLRGGAQIALQSWLGAGAAGVHRLLCQAMPFGTRKLGILMCHDSCFVFEDMRYAVSGHALRCPVS
jgi:hypothetical protein